jgi:Concanavalin A-like lectin/glucanases superfamily/Calcineurin-like phosphoesterase
LAEYHYSPFKKFNGTTDFLATPSTTALQLNHFTCACWFRTTKVRTPLPNGVGEGFMVAKGGWLSGAAGQNLSYGLWHSDADHLRGGFEETTSADHICTTGTLINDGNWRHAVVTYDGLIVTLYMNGVVRDTHVTSATPEVNTQDLTVGRNPLQGANNSPLFFEGDLDEVYVWNEALTLEEVLDLYNNGNVPQRDKIVFENNFGGSGAGSGGAAQAQNIIEFRLSGGKTNTVKNSSLGGEMSEDPAALIQSSAILNFFDHVDLPRATSGEFNYLIEYINCKNNSEGLPSVKWWLDRDTLSDENEFAWSFDNTINILINQNSILFDGGNDLIDCTNDATLWSQSLTKFSFSFWFYPTSNTGSIARYLVRHNEAVANCFYCHTFNNDLAFKMNFGAGDVQVFGSFGAINTWHHALVTYDSTLGSNEMKIYLDGNTTPLAQGQNGGAVNLSATLQLGGNATAGHLGNMKQFKWWTTVALTGTDAANLFAGNDSLVTTPNYNLPMDEGQGNPVDTISGTKVGTLTNGALWDNTIKTIRTSGHKYRYEPHKKFNGTSDFNQITHTAAYSVTQFSIGCWFRTSASGALMFMIVKGSTTSETAGTNVNYSLAMTSSNTVQLFWETSAGVDKVVTSPLTYNDGKWHFALGTYDQVTIRLYIDGKEVANLAETAAPDNNPTDIYIGVNNGGASNFWNGDLDEIRIWNNDLTAREQADLFTFGTIPQTAAVVYTNKFGDDNGSRIAQVIPNITTEPLLSSWKTAQSEPSGSNFYQKDIKQAGSNNPYNSYFPMLIRRRILANSNSSMDNQGMFKLKGLLRRSNSDQGSGDGGTTPPPQVTNVTFGVTGDCDCNSTFDKLLGVAKTNGMSNFLITGDITYNGPSCMGSKFPDHKVLVVVNGNHDGGSKISFWRSFMGVQQNYYRKDIQNICILGMDSEQSFSSGSAQYTFISNELKNASEDNNVDWIIVMIHRPFISASSTHPENEGNKADIYFPLFTQYKVDLVLQSHNHNLQRSKLIVDNPSNHTAPTVVTSGSTFVKGQGFVVMNNGTGGHDTGNNLYGLGSPKAWTEYQDDTTNAVSLLQWSGTNNAKLTAMIHDINNEMKDSFTIS